MIEARIADCEFRLINYGYAPNPYCPICQGGGVVHPVRNDGSVDYSVVIDCPSSECIEKSYAAYRRGDTHLAAVGISPKKQKFESFQKRTGTQETFKKFKDLATGEAGYMMLLCYGGTGNGKCLARGTKVVMADGHLRNVEDIKIGDMLMGKNGDTKSVSMLHRGYGPLYKVKQSKGLDYVVNENHILYLRKAIGAKNARGELMPSGNYRRSKGKHAYWGDEVCISVKDYLKQSCDWRKHFYGYRASADFPYKPIAIDPYFLGLWLGDGSSDRVAVTTEDEIIKDFLYAYAADCGLKIYVHDQHGNRTPEYIFRHMKRRPQPHKLQQYFRGYGLFNNKHIPSDYLHNTTAIRLEVLAGYIDADGYLNSNCYEGVTKSLSLAKDIQYLCHSVGLRCSINLTQKSIKSLNFKGEYYRLNISGNTHIIPVRLERRKIVSFSKNKNTFISSIQVESVGEGEYFGFEIGGDGLFLLEDFTITHNTHLCNALALTLLDRGVTTKLYTVSDMVSELRVGISNNTVESMIKKLKQVEALILDDYKPEYGSVWEMSRIEEIIDARYRDALITVLTTNKGLETVPDRITSRFMDPALGMIIFNEGSDYRMKRR